MNLMKNEKLLGEWFMEIKGITDSVTTCDCCGKTNLKRTVAIETENGEIVYYGTSCAATYLKVSGNYTARTAEKMVAKFHAMQERKRHFDDACKRAQIQANATGQAQDVVRTRDGVYVVRGEAANTGYRYICPRATFEPQAESLNTN